VLKARKVVALDVANVFACPRSSNVAHAMSHNTLIHRLVRPPVRLLAPTRIRPNHITALRIASAIGASLCFANGAPNQIWAGAGLFIGSALLDRADGELARLTRQFSPLGHRLDLIADFSSTILVFLAIGIGASKGWLEWRALALGGLAGLGAGMLFWHLNHQVDDRRRPLPSRLFDPDDLVLSVPILACWVGLAPVVLLAGTIVALWLIWWDRRPANFQGQTASRDGRPLGEPVPAAFEE
jgi:archaetidylinositol phosphate synthase